LEGPANGKAPGLYFPDGLRLMNAEANLSAVPDGTYVSNRSLKAGRVQFVEGREGGFTELEGSPDVVIEVVSNRSEDKDTEWLMSAYWDAGVREYWLIDARSQPLKFDIHRHSAKGFVPARKESGWLKSAVFRKSFRLMQRLTPLGHPDYTLAVR
jgi:Uma2 family endonuclease